MPLPTTTLRFPNRYSRQGHYCVLCVIELACACVPMLRARTGQIRRFLVEPRPPTASARSVRPQPTCRPLAAGRSCRALAPEGSLQWAQRRRKRSSGACLQRDSRGNCPVWLGALGALGAPRFHDRAPVTQRSCQPQPTGKFSVECSVSSRSTRGGAAGPRLGRTKHRSTRAQNADNKQCYAAQDERMETTQEISRSAATGEELG